MKNKITKIFALVAILANGFFAVNCQEKKEDKSALLALLYLANEQTGTANCDLIKETVSISAGNIVTQTWKFSKSIGYLLNGTVIVPSGVTLTIEPGVCVFGSSTAGGALLVKQGGKIVAEGTQERPIVFTSDKAAGSRSSGDWQGVILQGNGIQTFGGYGSTATGEGDVGTFGGSTDTESSGTLKYVRIEFAGKAFSPGNERNCLSLMGVGSGTTIQYVQCHKSLDDAFEWWGGAVNMKYLLATDSRDDNFDFTDGYTGKVQFAIAHMGTNITSNDDTSRCIEGDGNSATTCTSSKTSSGTCADPMFANVTCIGANDASKQGDAIYLRRGSIGRFTHFLVEDFGANGAAINCSTSGQAVTSVVSNVYKVTTTKSDTLQSSCTASSTASSGVKTKTITAPNYIPTSKTTVSALSGITGFSDSFFTSTDYAGGMDPTATASTESITGTAWTSGWTSFPAN